MKKELSIVKIGGQVIEEKEQLSLLFDLFASLKGPKILVHGGGKKATDIGEKLGVKTALTNGRRITDNATLDIVVMVYAGLINKNLVAQLQKRKCNAIGLSGADANLIQAIKRPVNDIDFGWVGDIEAVNSGMLTSVLETGMVPVFCALTHDGEGQLLNTNADTIASGLAVGLSKEYDVQLYYCFEQKGVLEDIRNINSVIPHIDPKSYKELLHKGSIADGMLPKLENCFAALNSGVSSVCIGNIDMLKPNYQEYTRITL